MPRTRKDAISWREPSGIAAPPAGGGGALAGPYLGVGLLMLALHYTSTGVAATIVALVPIALIPAVVLIVFARSGFISRPTALLLAGLGALPSRRSLALVWLVAAAAFASALVSTGREAAATSSSQSRSIPAISSPR